MLVRRKAVRDVAGKSERFEVYVTASALKKGVAKMSGELSPVNPKYFRADGVRFVVGAVDWHRTTEGIKPALERVRALVKARREAMTREFEKLAEIEEGLARGVLPMRKEVSRGK